MFPQIDFKKIPIMTACITRMASTKNGARVAQ